MLVTTESELVAAVREKRIPNLRSEASRADLSLQEMEILNAMRDCDSLSKVNTLLDKFIAYVALSKCRLNSEG